MKARLNLTIEDNLLSKMKLYAAKQQTSISELVEDYFSSITKPTKRKSLIKLVEALKAPAIEVNVNLKDLFYKDQAKKYGF